MLFQNTKSQTSSTRDQGDLKSVNNKEFLQWIQSIVPGLISLTLLFCNEAV